MKNDFWKGIRDGFPIFLGYFFVSFGVGIFAVKSGLASWVAVVISATNLTSAGQVAGIGVIAAGGTYLEIVLTQALINCRYSLMALTLSQNLADEFTPMHRAIAAFGITDEIFGVAATRKEPLTPRYMYGMIAVASAGWVGGTWLGAVSGNLFPPRVTAALGILLYGMFLAIIVPPVRTQHNNLWVILIAGAASCLIYYCLPMISAGFSVIISAVIAAVVLALLAPVKEDEL